VIDSERARVRRMELVLPAVAGRREGLRIGVHHGHDDSGDGAVRFRLLGEGDAVLFEGAARSKGWEWFEAPVGERARVVLSIEDADTKLSGRHPGNVATVAAALAYRGSE